MVNKSSVTTKSDRGNAVLTSGAKKTRASTADQSQKQTLSTEEPCLETAKTRESAVEDVKFIKDIHKKVEVTPT